MKITKRDLKKMIMEVLQESEFASPETETETPTETPTPAVKDSDPEDVSRTELQAQLRGITGTERSSAAGKNTPREVSAMSFVQTLQGIFDEPGESVDVQVITFLKRALAKAQANASK